MFKHLYLSLSFNDSYKIILCLSQYTKFYFNDDNKIHLILYLEINIVLSIIRGMSRCLIGTRIKVLDQTLYTKDRKGIFMLTS